MIAMHFKRLWKNPVTLCITIFIFAMLIIPMYIMGMEKVMRMDYSSSMAIEGMIALLPYLFFVFIFLSYELFYGWNKSQIQEIVVGGTKNKLWDKASCALLLLFIDLIACMLTFGYSLKVCYDNDVHSSAFLLYHVRVIFIYQFLCCAMAVAVGWVAAHIRSRVWGISFLLLITYLFDGGFIRTVMDIDFKNYSIWEFGLLFCSFFRSARAMEGVNYFLTAENVNMFRNLFWIFFFISAGLFIGRRKKIYAVVSSAVTVAVLILYLQPSGAQYQFFASSGFDASNYPYMYYGDCGWRQEVDFEKYIGQSRDDFSVKEYGMQLKVDDILSAKVSVVPDNTGLSEYQFTLYHKYELAGITDGDGRPLKFERDSDYISVYNQSGSLDEIVFEYSGYEQWFYTTTQGVFLGANFPYYPKAGWKRVYLDENTALVLREPMSFWAELPKEKAEFNVDLYTKGNWPTYSNIAQKGESVRENGYSHTKFEGETDGITLMGNPYLHEKYVSGVRMVYSDAENSIRPTGDVEKKYIEEFAELEKKGYSFSGKTFFVSYIAQYGSLCMGEDQFIGDYFDIADRAENYNKYGIIYERLSDEEIRKKQEDIDAFIKETEEMFEESQ